jgi:hypothetical protein
MFYGLKLNLSLSLNAKTLPIIAQYKRRLHLQAINELTHQVIKFPSNFDDLPNVLRAQVWKLKGGGRQPNIPLWAWESKFVCENINKKTSANYDNMTENFVNVATAEALDDYHDENNFGTYYRAIGPGIEQYKEGRCGEYSALAVNKLLESGTDYFNIKCLGGSLGRTNNHVCVVVGAEKDAVAGDPTSFGNFAVICDPWLDLVAYPTEYFHWLGKIDCEFTPNRLTGLYETASN